MVDQLLKTILNYMSATYCEERKRRGRNR